MTLVVDLLRRRPAVLDELRRRYRYILVDEFQDTNFVQFELVKMLAAGHRNLTVVGDDDQSIFRFRGASLSNILEFEEVFPEAKRIVLTRNYRSTQPILDASYRLIQHNNPNRLEFKDKVDKRLRAAVRGRGKSIHMLSVRHAGPRGRRRGRPRPRDPRRRGRLEGHGRPRPPQRRRRPLPALLQHEADPLPVLRQPGPLPAGRDQGHRRLHPGR